MAFSKEVKTKALLACRRVCCLCYRFRGTKMEVHHIRPVAQGGEDTYENAIPLCLDCHAEVENYNSKHPKGNKYSQKELIELRDDWYDKVKDGILLKNYKQEIDPMRVFKTEDSDPVALVRVFTGKQLIDQIGDPYGLDFDYDEPASKEIQDKFISFTAMIQDSLDLLPDLTLPERVKLGFQLTELINEFDKIGYFVFANRSNAFIKYDVSSMPSNFNISIIHVLKKDNPRIIYLDKIKDETSI